MLDDPLPVIRHRRGLPVIGYVKTHHRRMLAREHWVRVPELTAEERSRLFAMGGRSLRLLPALGRPGAVGGFLGGHRPPGDAVPGLGRAAAVEAADRAAGWLPGFASGSAPGREGPR